MVARLRIRVQRVAALPGVARTLGPLTATLGNAVTLIKVWPPARRGVLLLGTLAAIVLLFAAISVRSGGNSALATLPTPTAAPGLDFSIGSDVSVGAGAVCDSSGAPTDVCQVPLNGAFKLSFFLHDLPSDMGSGGYVEYWAYLEYDGVTNDGTQASIDPYKWPGCVDDTRSPAPGVIGITCAIGSGASASTYTGRMATVAFTCAADGTVKLVHTEDGVGYPNTSMRDVDLTSYSESYEEWLTIECVPAAAYPADTDGDGCPDSKESDLNPMTGGLRNYLNAWDYFDPEKVYTPNTQTVADILRVVNQYAKNVGNPLYTNETDRTGIPDAYPWSLGPPNGTQTVADILAAVRQFGHNCA